MTAMREIQKREDMRWVIYTDSLCSMLATQNIRENHSILNQIYDILAELYNQGNRLFYAKSLHTKELQEIKRQLNKQ